MNRSRRLLSYAAAAIAGLAATFVIASPASAHHVNTTGTATCDPSGNGWNVAWTVVGPEKFKNYYQIDSLTLPAGGGPITGELGSLPTAWTSWNVAFTGSEHFPNSVNSATLIAHSQWNDSNPPVGSNTAGPTEEHTTVYKPNNCTPKPGVSFKSNCDGTITITLINTDGKAPATFHITGQSDQTVPGGQTKDLTVPGGAEVTVTSTGMDDKRYKFSEPTTCSTPTPSPSPTLPTTGNHLTTVVGVGVGLVVVGIGLIASLFVFRRRRSVVGG